MEDVLIRLRRVPKYPGLTLCKDAASEIERLQRRDESAVSGLSVGV